MLPQVNPDIVQYLDGVGSPHKGGGSISSGLWEVIVFDAKVEACLAEVSVV